MTVDRWQALAEELLARPFPAEELSTDTAGERAASGPGYHVVAVAASEEFWDDPDGARVRAASAELEARRAELVSALSAAWGPPEKKDFWPSPGPLGTELMNSWGMSAADTWIRDGRVICIDVGQIDKEWALELVVGVGADRGDGRP